MTEEPSVLDFVKSLLTPWKGRPIPIPAGEPEDEGEPGEAPHAGLGAEAQTLTPSAQPPAGAVRARPQEQPIVISWPWRALLALPLALAAQAAFAPQTRDPVVGGVLLFLAAGFVVWALYRGEWRPAPIPAAHTEKDPFSVKASALLFGLLAAMLAFLACGTGEFTLLNLSLLGLSLFYLARALWRGRPAVLPQAGRLRALLSRGEWRIPISRWTVVVLLATALVLFFRLYQLDQVPPEMVSDHAEKFLDVQHILGGHTRIFFPRNGGREALQFYLLAAMKRYFGADFSHLTLKISTALIGLLALPYVYLLGKEIANRRVALIAFTFAGIAYWTNVVARAGMRLPFYMVFSAATLYHLLRGLRTADRNQFLLSGFFLGLSFYGYSANRLLPVVVVAALLLYLLHSQAKGQRKQVIWQAILLALIALVVFLPMLRYIILDPQGALGRSLSRLSASEHPLPGPALQIFLDNLWRALAMFSWSNGVVWGVSIPDYPALNVVAGGLFYLGAALVLARYVRKRHWLDLYLLLSIPLLLLPSILSLAFPAENPSLYRTGGAMVPVFLLVGIALDGLMSGLQAHLRAPWGSRFAWAALLLLLGWSALQDYGLVFEKYYQQYRLSAWNYTEMGTVMRSFSETIGSPDTAWLMGYPHWADTRLVAINAGNLNREYAMFVEVLDTTQADPRPKLFIIHPGDEAAIQALSELYPDGWLQTYTSSVETKDFLMYFVPPEE